MKRPHTIIVGGAGAIGSVITASCIKDGHKISVIGRRASVPHSWARHGKTYWSADVSNPAEFSGLFSKIIAVNGKPHNLVFCQRYRGERNEWDGEVGTTVKATCGIMQALRHRLAGEKSVVIIGSMGARFVDERQSLEYHLAKAGIEQIVRFQAIKLGKLGIRINCVVPGTLIKYDLKKYPPEMKNAYKRFGHYVPLGRMGTSMDVANAVLLLCDSKASFITGQTLVVDGGLSLCGQESIMRGSEKTRGSSK